MEEDLSTGPTGDSPLRTTAARSEYEREMSFLKQPCPRTGHSLYDHLCDIVHYALANKGDSVDFEERSRMLRERRRHASHAKKRGRLTYGDDRLEYAIRVRGALTEGRAVDARGLPLQGKAFNKAPDEDEVADFADVPDVLDTLRVARQAGVAIPHEEAMGLAIAIKGMAADRTLTRVRFWGKVLCRGGTDYWVVQAELADDELDRRVDLVGPAEQGQLEDPLNRKVYLVCTEASEGGPWRELPAVGPRQVGAARARDPQRALLTGCLDAQVPDFPGTEAHLLHAQLLRISSSCSVSPLGAFARSAPSCQDLAEDECGVSLNADWAGVPASVSLAELADPGLRLWVHHSPFLLRSGRLDEPGEMEGDRPQSAEGFEEEEEEEEDEAEEEEEEDEDSRGISDDGLLQEQEDSLQGEPSHAAKGGVREPLQEQEEDDDEEGEEGEEEDEGDVALLAPLSRDAPLTRCSPPLPQGSFPAWTARTGSTLLPQTRTALVRSNRWPGAVAFCSGRKFGHVYIGWGLKDVGTNQHPSRQ